MQPLIAITTDKILRSGDEWVPAAHGQSHTYPDAVVHAGGAPFFIPIIDNEVVLRKLYEQCHGLMLSGGGDIDPALYRAKPLPLPKKSHQMLSPQRDRQELLLLKWALEDDKPVLGICRGMQLINVALGGSLYQDLATEMPEAANHELSALQKDFNHLAHTLKIDSDSKLSHILGTDAVKTNALHHQAIKQLGKGLVATAHAEDGIIEAIELPDKHFVIGVQSHPETLEMATEISWNKLFKAFVKAAAA
ncbi:MAG TPA: gamma-glutamyl-gamma-aminobutyrate hydrolase family protein [Candidatus Saccharimonadales bacterium]|nr:gamma-glutamyl-gamma-aminobutyrate hydrolase family protein [Candidatus Saccharimonadales bacterium]